MRAYGALCEIDLSSMKQPKQMGRGRSSSSNDNDNDVNLHGGGGNTTGALVTQVMMMYHFDCHILFDYYAYLRLLK